MSSYASPTATTTRSTSNGLAVAGLVCGIVGLFILNVILGPLAIIFGGVSWSKANNGATHKAMAVWSVALGIVDVAVFVVLLAVASHHGGYWHVG
jgi:hypothetical protein